ncbi:hypothetical protein [Cellulomonas sp. NPDC089187]|uniref:hypothetical protein n=1 Tax=Cellulomonas sp. NPDC089187 TaxID=3154970 RepID=UPI0034357331
MAARTLVIPTGDGSAPQVLRYDDGALSSRGRTVAWVIAAMLLFLGTGVLSAVGLTPITGATTGSGGVDATGDDAARVSAPSGGAGAPAVADRATQAGQAAPVGTAGDPNELPDVIGAQWDGPTVHVDWTGNHYTTVEADFVGDRVASPGDRVERTLTLVNEGPADAVMTVNLLLSQTVPEGTTNPDFSEAIDLFWNVAGVAGTDTFATLLAQGSPTIAEVVVPRHATARITVGFLMPVDVDGHRSDITVDSTALHFQLQARMRGDTPSAPPALVALPDLAITGAQVAGAALLVVGLLLVGWLLVAVARRRRCDDCGRRIGRGEEWTVRRGGDAPRRVQCADCQPAPGSD